MANETYLPYLTWLGFSALIGSMTVRWLDLWRLRTERHHNAAVARNKDLAGNLAYPWLAQHPVWIGLVVGVVALAIGWFLIYSYRKAERYWATLPAPEAA
ncbi:MAG TPA: hypothetical protein VH482_26285 [Thermomicrobiales bacterium]